MGNDKVFPCRNWNKPLKACNCKLLNQEGIFKHIKTDENNFDSNCNGFSNCSKCVSFAGIDLSEMDIKLRDSIKIYESDKL